MLAQVAQLLIEAQAVGKSGRLEAAGLVQPDEQQGDGPDQGNDTAEEADQELAGWRHWRSDLSFEMAAQN
jgi:hypothetical protein